VTIPSSSQSLGVRPELLRPSLKGLTRASLRFDGRRIPEPNGTVASGPL
jgi:hypothetical protein